MAIVINNSERFTNSQQKEIVQLANNAYDKGGADALKICLEACDNIQRDIPDAAEFVKFTRHVIEAARQSLSETIAKDPEPTLITV